MKRMQCMFVAMVIAAAVLSLVPAAPADEFTQEDLKRWPVKLRELISAGEPLNPEVIEQVKKAWGITIRDGYGQTETTAQVGNSSRDADLQTVILTVTK